MPTKWRLFKQKYNKYFRRWSPKHRPTTLDQNGYHLYLPPPLKITIFNLQTSFIIIIYKIRKS